MGRSHIGLVVVATEFSALLDHAVSSLIAWHHLQVLCLRVDDGGRYEVHLPLAWTTFGQWKIESGAVEVFDLTFAPDESSEELDETACWALLSTALDLVRRDGERYGTTGFAFVWSDLLYPQLTSGACGITVAQVSPLAAALDSGMNAFLGDLKTPLRTFIVGTASEEWPPVHADVQSAQRFLSAFGTTEIGGLTTWDRLRTDMRHRSDGFIFDRRAQPLEFTLWGALGDYGAELLANPARLRRWYRGHLKPGVSLGQPMLAMRLIDRLVVGEEPAWLGAQWFSSLGFRLSRLRAHLQVWPDEGQPAIRRQLLPLLTWASFDVAAIASDLEAFAEVSGSGIPPPVLPLGSTPAAWDSHATVDTIDRLAEWVRAEVIGEDAPVMRAMFDLAFMHGWLLDRYIESVSPANVLEGALSDLADVGRDRLFKLLRTTSESPDQFGPLVEQMTETFEDFDASDPFDSVASLSTGELLAQFVTGIPRLHDLLIEPLGLRLPFTMPDAVDWDALRDRIVELVGRGVPAVLAIEPSGGVGISILDYSVVPVDTAQETWVLIRSGLVSVTMRASWDELRQGAVPWASIPFHEL